LGDWLLLGTFDQELRNFAFDDAGIAVRIAFGKPCLRDIVEQPLHETGQVFGGGHLKLGEGVADDVEGIGETELVGVEGLGHSGLMHKRAEGIVREEQPIGLRDNAPGLLAAEGEVGQALMGLDFINGDFDLPALMVGGG